MASGQMDEWLQKRLEKYGVWLDKKKITYSSKVVPIRESMDDKQWILPTEQVLGIIQNAEIIALADCVCRSHYKHCAKPVEVCLLLGDYGKKLIEKGLATRISPKEAVPVLKIANQEGLVHLSLYRPDHKLYALCSCCACCCHDLQLLIDHRQSQLVAHSDYVARTDTENCTNCGQCIKRCVFGARSWADGEMNYDSEQCFGCGLCATTCPADAIEMEIKFEEGSQR